MNKKSDLWILVGTTIFVLIVIVGISVYLFNNIEPDPDPDPQPPIIGKNIEGVGKFSTEEEFYAYIQWANNNVVSRSPQLDWSRDFNEMATGDDLIGDIPTGIGGIEPPTVGSEVPDRFSGTNTQVLMVDEADKVKTDGTHIYYSTQFSGWYDDDRVFIDEPSAIMDSIVAPEYASLTQIIDALPPAEASLVAELNEGGEMYLHENMLIFTQTNGVKTFDISDATDPKADWSLSYSNEGVLNTSRLYDGYLYLVLDQYIYGQTPCPIPLMVEGGEQVTIPCTDIYRPNGNVYVDSLVTVIKVDPKTGSVEKKLSFVGSSYTSDTYMSGGNLYITYQQSIDEYELVSDFIKVNRSLFTQPILDKIEQLDGYDITTSSKIEELNNVLDQYSLFLDADERSKFRNDINNAFDTYVKTKVRSFTSTGLVRIESENLEIAATGDFPGVLLNQFSMDEHENNLRIATTVGGSTWGSWFQTTIEQQNDVLVLDEELNTIGSVQGLGLTESVYSARFIGEVGYIVTFRQVDPFYVIDLSDPQAPEMKGELKIPGYSSYLHPLSDEIIMGVGQESGRVKISLFDVSDPTYPTEVSKYILTDYWSEVESNHHAFLNDPDHQVVFIPGSQGGYIFGYEGDELELVRTVTGYTVDRAVYIDDFMYILSAEQMTVLDENSWEIVKDLDL